MERRKGTRKQVHNTTLHSVNCTKLFTAEGILPRRDNPTGRARGRAFPRGQRSKTRKYVRCNVAPYSPTSPTSQRARPSGRLGGERGPPFPVQQLRGQPGRHNPSVARTTPPLEAKPKKSHRGQRWGKWLLTNGTNGWHRCIH